MSASSAYWDILLKEKSKKFDHEKLAYDNSIVGFNKKKGTEFLSNFYCSTISYDGGLYPTVEHAYQASKTLNQQTREIIRKSKSPYGAKKLGRSIYPSDNWEKNKIDIMKELVKEKFQNPFLKFMLINTGNSSLINENSWGDRFWGTVNGVGENWLGRILQEVREETKIEDSVDF